jgi:hypothetical protein
MIACDTGVVVCNKCKESSAASEDEARAARWGIDTSVTPTVHLCPECMLRSVVRDEPDRPPT